MRNILGDLAAAAALTIHSLGVKRQHPLVAAAATGNVKCHSMLESKEMSNDDDDNKQELSYFFLSCDEMTK
jgi:hypothetical protein